MLSYPCNSPYLPKQYYSIGQAAEYLGVSQQTLRRWHEDGSFKPTFVSEGGHRFYSVADLEKHAKGLWRLATEWASSATPFEPQREFYCPNKDVFKARLERMATEIDSRPALKDLGPIVTSVAGEIGNNSFDHNIGNWPDVLGAFFAYDLGKRVIVLADRGQGILTTLRRAKSDLKDDEDALRVAFTEFITGRTPEHRGNGLKFVRGMVTDNDLELTFQAGAAMLRLKKGDQEINVVPAPEPIRGCLSLIKF